MRTSPTGRPTGTEPLVVRTLPHLVVISALALTVVAGDVRISEIRIDQPGPDVDEYFELVGPPGMSLEGLHYIVIGDGAPSLGSGVIEGAYNLNAFALDGGGRFVAAKSTFTLGVPDAIFALNFENNDNVTHMLVRGFTGALNLDLDVDDDGVLDISPWLEVVDSIGVIGPNYPPTAPGEEWVYSDVIVGPDITRNGLFTPSHVYRCGDVGAWQIGPFELPPIGVDTPGAANPACDRPIDCSADLNGDGVVDGADLGILLSQWGRCE